ncbi:MAG: bactofilin family protein [Candidatus Limnocylindria bacterium]
MRDFGGQSSTATLNALLGAGSVFEGKLHFEGQVRIDGTFTGEITTTDMLVIGEGAKVSATINCGSVEIKGDITGNINATESIALRATAHVQADIYAPSLVIDKGAVFEGNSRMTGGARSMVTVAAADRRERHKKGKGAAFSRELVPSGRSAQDNGHGDEGDDHPAQ